MKTYVLSAIVCCLSLTLSAAKIINGYDENIESALASLEHLNRLPQEKSVLTRIAHAPRQNTPTTWRRMAFSGDAPIFQFGYNAQFSYVTGVVALSA